MTQPSLMPIPEEPPTGLQPGDRIEITFARIMGQRAGRSLHHGRIRVIGDVLSASPTAYRVRVAAWHQPCRCAECLRVAHPEGVEWTFRPNASLHDAPIVRLIASFNPDAQPELL
jgi:hypothetical protein